MKPLTSLLGLPLLLGACAVGPDYTAPRIDAPEQFVSQEVLTSLNEGKTEATTYETDWWKGFKDPLLEQLVNDGLAENYQIAVAMAQLQAAQAGVKLAGSTDNLFIGTDADAGLDHSRQLDNNGTESNGRGASAALGAVLPLDIFGKTRRNVEVAEAGLLAAHAELRGVILGVSTEITQEYLLLRGNQRQLELLRESVALQEKTLSIVRSRYDSGLSPELDLRRAETSVENLRADIPPLEEALITSRNRLARLTGRYPGAYEELLATHVDIPHYTNTIPEWMPLDVLTLRPNVQQAEAELKAAIASIGVAKADYYPSFELAGALRLTSSKVSGAPVMDILFASLSALLDQVITDGGARSASVDIATARAEAALAGYQDQLRAAAEEVEASLAAIQASQARQKALAKAASSSNRSFSQAETLYQQGLISFLDVVDAQRVLASAEQRLASERTRYATEIAELFQALGVEVSRPDDNPDGDGK